MTQETLYLLHSDRDLVAAIDFDSYYETYRLAAFYLARLDASDIE